MCSSSKILSFSLNPDSGDQLPISAISPKSGFDSGDQFPIRWNWAPDSGDQLPILAIRTDLDLRHDLLVKKQHACEIETVTNTYTGYSFFHSQKLAEAQNSQQVHDGDVEQCYFKSKSRVVNYF